MVLDSRRGPVSVMTMAPMGAVITMDKMHKVDTISAYPRRTTSSDSATPTILPTSSIATGPRAACNIHIKKMNTFVAFI